MSFKRFTLLSVVLTAMIFLLSACINDDDIEYFIYQFGITSAVSSDNNEMETIELAYNNAFKNAGLVFNSEFFPAGTSKEDILKACTNAENAISKSSAKFVGYYVYEIRVVKIPKDETIYIKEYGSK